MIAYKLVRDMGNGTFASLFIDLTKRFKIGDTLIAQDCPTKGYAHRPGWHCTLRPVAPHLKLIPKSSRPRVWLKVRLSGAVEKHHRPDSQGGMWLTAEKMEILGYA